jgi:hypothetical protein
MPLTPDFVRPFCHPLATDGVFLAHFELEKEVIIRAVHEPHGDDALVERWFLSQPTPAGDYLRVEWAGADDRPGEVLGSAFFVASEALLRRHASRPARR